MKITFHGAARTVTGTQHLIEINGRHILLDCGLYQGKREEANIRNRTLPFPANQIDVVVLSHAHIDHSGNLPNLVKSGFTGDIYATFATRDLCGAMLLDSAHIQEADVEYVNKHRARKGEPPVEPMYTQEDAMQALDQFHAIAYNRSVQILPGVHVTFLDAGHMLGSAIVVLNMEDRDNNRETTLIFSGDIGRPGLPILRDPSRVDRADVLIMESTYGDRVHEPFEDSSRKFAAIINETYRRGGKIIIPSFAVGRTQELIYAVNQLVQTKKVPPIPVFIDSPLAIDVTAVFMQHPEAYDAETRAFMAEQGGMRDPFGFAGLKYTRTREQSMELNFMRQPAIIISASGMAETGRIQHHLKNNIEDPDNTVLIVGYQAENTLGRRIQEKADKVKIFGEWYDLRARVETLSGFSAHADRNDLLNWAGAIKKKPLQTFLVHGEIGPMQALKQALHDELGFERVEAPELHQSFEV